MEKEIINFDRQELFDHYHSCDNPFMIITTKIDITNIVNYCKKNRNFYATLGYVITKTVNQIDAFKYRYKDGKIYYCDPIKSNYTQKYEDDTIGYFNVEYTENFNEYIVNFLNIQKEFIENKKYSTENGIDEVWISCVPWISFSACIPPFSKENTIPQFIWDKYAEVNGKYYIDLMIMVHHGFADGFHLGKFIEALNENVKSFDT